MTNDEQIGSISNISVDPTQPVSTNTPTEQPATIDSVKLIKKTDWMVRAYFMLAKFVVAGFVIFIALLLINSVYPQINSPNFFATHHIGFIPPLLVTLGAIWLFMLATMLPLGIMLYGIWGIINKESALHMPWPIHPTYPVMKLSGIKAQVSGWVFLVAGLLFLWGEIGVIVSFVCGQNPTCMNLPNFIKFF